ncbi:similar to Saccharomyces cerevisiae YGL111W NSA1 Constituent of 66S pre-ribosomal particles, involved in 60S ribosomal subunit biogenesis [Maudiozyma saulgeensis]|uniref:Ribosome biogenesis protein NSA1 n=1 Tax=Maudiozyma saulgeensis TaxID=1789683 RepID=A0A1X7RAA3_9SACH|nr:similar to Saccharomyces cerevisiae YGL111W NSA1 Constituent of 66S pre-ribosomal particles, involved in 60S ribosomal subunit biogenesis [Kazachstania saulgeensis]
MRLLVSCTHNGSLKEIVCNPGTDTSIQTATQPLSVKSHMIENANAKISQLLNIEDTLVVARDNGTVELYHSKRVPHTVVSEDVTSTTEGESIDLKPEFDITEFESLSTVKDLLDDTILESISKKSSMRTKIYDTFVNMHQLPNNKDILLLATKSGLIHIIEIKKRKNLKLIKTHKVIAPLDFAQIYDNTKSKSIVFAYGGEENLVKLVQLSNNFKELTKIWEAKNVANDRLDMRVPVWPTGLKFLNPQDSDKIDSDKLNYQFVVVTHWSHLGIYQTQHGRKPLQYIDLLPKREPLARLEMVGDLTPTGNLKSSDINNFSLITTDLKKNVMRFNNKGRLITKFGKDDIVGSPYFVKTVNGKYVLQGGLDRYVRVFDLESARRIAKVYVTGKCNNILLLDDEDVEIPQLQPKGKQSQKKRHQPENETEQDVEELWDHLEENNTSKKAKK